MSERSLIKLKGKFYRVLSAPPGHDKVCVSEHKAVTRYEPTGKPTWIDRAELAGAKTVKEVASE